MLVNGAATQTVPRHVVSDYARIWAHYFRDPHSVSDPDSELALNTINKLYSTPALKRDDPPTIDPTPRFGLRAGALKTYHTAIMQHAPPGQSIPIDVVDASANEYSLDVTKIPGAAARWRQETVEEWTSARFEDLYSSLFGVAPPVELEKVPMYLGASKQWLSSIDIDGTAGSDFGSVVGKLTGQAQWGLPRKFFKEQGTVWVLATLRPHPVFTQAKHYLDNVARFREFSTLWGTKIAERELPRSVNLDEIFWNGASNTRAGYVPSQQHYRTHPSFSHIDLDESDTGWEARDTPLTGAASQLTPPYEDVFATLRGGHGKLFCLNRFSVRRLVGDVMGSIQGR